jgi:GDP/UDP-N,N'-diacetylbacillosamine 2-epimerase (hydrolysing)
MKGPSPVSSFQVDVFTGNRADYGLLHPLLQGCTLDNRLTPRLLIGGEHGVHPASFLEAISLPEVKHRLLFSLHESQAMMSQPVAWRTAYHQQAALAFWQAHGAPSALIILGDRYETMGISLAAFTMHIPIMHLAAGDLTQGGVMDDRLRFSMTSLATVAVAFSEQSAQRLQHREELPEGAWVRTPSLAVDNALGIPRASRETVCQRYGLDPRHSFVMVTQHPMRTEGQAASEHVMQTLEAVAQYPSLQALVTAPNEDADTPHLAAHMQAFCAKHPRLRFVSHMGRKGYTQALPHAAAVVGNSSSGLYETPLFRVPCLNIGPRQAGRERGHTVLDCDYGVNAVREGLHTVLTDKAFQEQVATGHSPFGTEPATPTLIARVVQMCEHSR